MQRSGGCQFEAQGNSSREPYLKKTHHKKGLVEWLKVKALSSSPNSAKKITEFLKTSSSFNIL
jgi:uncharacterized protein YxeA